MSYAVRLTAQAHEDLTKSITWYDGQQNLGAQFLKAVNQTFSFIAKQPQAYAIKHKYQQVAVRAAPIKKFPFVVLYFLDEKRQDLVVLAVWHTSQDPHKWEERL